MATTIQDALTARGTHEVVFMESINAKTVSYGAVAKTVAMDAGQLAEIISYGTDGAPNMQSLSAVGNVGYLLVPVPPRYMEEELSQCYVGIDEPARLYYIEKNYTTFTTTAFTPNAALTIPELVRDFVAHYDVATKKYIVSDPGALHAGYAGSRNKFTVKRTVAENDGRYDGRDMITLIASSDEL